MPNNHAQFAIQAAIRQAYHRKHEYVTVEHLLYALLHDAGISKIVRGCSADPEALRGELDAYLAAEIPEHVTQGDEHDPKQTLGFRRVLERAVLQVHASDRSHVKDSDVLVAIHAEQESYASYLLRKHGISRMDLLDVISHGGESQDTNASASELEEAAEGGLRPGEDPLEKFCVDLTEMARQGRLDPLVGREHEMERIMQVLCRRTKNNPVLIGDSGVGKTAIVQGLGQKIADGAVPPVLKDAELFGLDLGGLLAGTKFRGQFEERMKAVMNALAERQKPVLFIDEIHMIAGAGSASGTTMDVSNMLKPVLQSGQLRCIGATTHEDFRRSLEQDRALVRRFQKIDIPASSVADTIEILQGLKKRYEEYHRVTYTRPALEEAAELSDRYITERQLPDKAIDVIDEAGARNQMRELDSRKIVLDREDIENVVAKIARIPDLNVTVDEGEKLAELDSEMKKVVFGQDDAVGSVVSAIKLSRAGLGHPDQPVGSFLFVGPTGVGKTEVARQLAAILGISFQRFDMSEYMEKHTVSRLIGAPPGYVGYDQGGLLTEAIRKNPHCVLLLDEIEKAHADLFDILLQVMDHATLTDNNGRRADFHNVILIMTSNAGSRDLSRKSIGFSRGIDVSKSNKEVERLFSPEFRNRLTEVVTFGPLAHETAVRIVHKFLDQLRTQLAAKKVELDVSPDAVIKLARDGFDDFFGARPLARLIQRKVRQPLAEAMLFGTLKNGGRVRLGVSEEELSFRYEAAASSAEN